MHVLTPGHHYALTEYKAKEDNTPTYTERYIHFQLRVGVGYPGNEGPARDGINCQEIIRMLIDRVKYLQGQIWCFENEEILREQRASLMHFENRAAARRGDQYYKDFRERWFDMQMEKSTYIEDIPACEICGHILCTKHEPEQRP